MTTNHYDVVIVGGGLAGLSSAAYLSSKGKKVAVLERGQLGGRAVTLKIKGFNFNFGAHAIYARDSSVLKTFEKELDLHIDWQDFNPTKAKYDIGNDLTAVPANVQGLFQTKLLKGLDKVLFTFEILKTMLKMETGHPHMSIQKWMEKKNVNEEVKEMMLTLASSNFFTREPEKIPSDVFFSYYSRLFTTNKPVAYIGGGWQALINEFVRVIEANNGVILTKTKVESFHVEEDRVVGVVTPEGEFTADEFISCIPPKEMVKVFAETRLEHAIAQHAEYEPTVVIVYDIGLKERIDVPYSYIYDKQNNIFITDISYYDQTCVPEGGQLLQATAYMRQSDVGNKELAEQRKLEIEALYDKHFAGWREQLVVPRVSTRAIVQEIKWTMNQKPMPIFMPDYRNLFFAGDWCEGQGQLSELSFSSAMNVAKLILEK
ncbi:MULTISPECIES: phytoene desaturase family protein [Brevibacillus]|jgi:phytoene dehydrogenase-like protein|uniref:Phytoene dehydrogenase-related protein n=2 Tax=Brevibacillus TaxID=55080 RepID=A0A1I3WFV4_9BACL|nr:MULTISPECIES: NAD(P)/FAD-dependent oxidoreductase [Brevibacillus]MEC2130990.1 NAD(P)/FAD-dependent oxidoreductase [Brevibacillus centrosporus]MED1792436.1 NAD(P)/FAD-dependent oxidoreductase [Brevibacillus nitrificans]MED1952449.1 NAD(P)/FAD-dependent oxidoreductase [Brevibacillus centrosporus]MED4907494.1 NAD(P)/FAD-dependent oxidoreductase [Brevibacillus centrosporus]RNB63349.1 NAD(P)/FAD-dependent oxidoreductase [Brevibacillus centrosporus]